MLRNLRVVVEEYNRAEREVVWLRSLLREVVASGVPSKDEAAHSVEALIDRDIWGALQHSAFVVQSRGL